MCIHEFSLRRWNGSGNQFITLPPLSPPPFRPTPVSIRLICWGKIFPYFGFWYFAFAAFVFLPSSFQIHPKERRQTYLFQQQVYLHTNRRKLHTQLHINRKIQISQKTAFFQMSVECGLFCVGWPLWFWPVWPNIGGLIAHLSQLYLFCFVFFVSFLKKQEHMKICTTLYRDEAIGMFDVFENIKMPKKQWVYFVHRWKNGSNSVTA